MEVELCPVSKLSQLLSQRFGKPLTPEFTQICKILSAASQQFMCVSLVSDIPYHLIFRKIKHQMHRHGKFHSQGFDARCPPLTDRADQELPDLICKQWQLFLLSDFDIIRMIYLLIP